MRRCAIIKDNVVIDVRDLSESEMASPSLTVVDIEDSAPLVSVGWVLEGNTLRPGPTLLSDEERRAQQQRLQRLFGQKLSPIVVDLVGARNLALSEQGANVDIVALATQMQAVKLLLETGALKTARGLCAVIKPAFPHHEDIIEKCIQDISDFLVSAGYE
jgi:hypothetical protein